MTGSTAVLLLAAAGSTLLSKILIGICYLLLSLLGLSVLALMGLLIWLFPGQLLVFLAIAGITACGHGLSRGWHKTARMVHHHKMP